MNKISQRAKKSKKPPKKKTKPKDAAPEGRGEHTNPPFTPPPYPILGELLKEDTLRQHPPDPEYLYSEQFLSYIKDWLQNPVFPLPLDQLQAMFLSLEQFQKTKNPEFLGRAISLNPLLLEINPIRIEVEMWILAPSITDKVEDKENRQSFCEGLQYKLGETPDEVAPSHENIRRTFEIIYERLANAFKQKRPKTPADRAAIIKDLFSMRKLLFDNDWCERWAKEREPRRIALLMCQIVYAYRRDNSFVRDANTRFKPPHRIGINKLTRIVSKKQ